MYLMYVYINENLNIYFDKFFNDFLNNNGDIYIFGLVMWFMSFFLVLCVFLIFLYLFLGFWYLVLGL